MIDTIVIVLISILLVSLTIFFITRRTKSEKEYDEKLKESLKEEFIIDPETGAKLTLEQAESGHWVAHDNEFRTLPEEEIQKLYTEEQKEAQRALNYLKRHTGYRKEYLGDERVTILEKSQILGKYDDWSYSHCYRIEQGNGLVFLPKVTLKKHEYNETQILFWIITNYDFGHYYFREKTSAEKLLDRLRNDDEIKLNNYESFTIQRSKSPVQMIQILKRIEREKGLEVEFMNSHIFLKNRRLVNLEDIYKMEEIVKAIF